ncbi:hypothetical protein LKO27_13315 [Tessaracoccus sp. OS52]|uniref:type II secretion system F family protein n=1 Tax=Tessaracoccus sp. OS52 TaxID=2886691 RepID=UPI001D103403|nr:hypothetical protein [Tessaracoccus sp. OS52]MCC2594383.1 hypothetical protein [Tessaracoccus sp. OS52]
MIALTALPAASLVALAVVVLVGEPPAKGLVRLRQRRQAGAARRWLPLTAVGFGLAWVWALFGGRTLGWVLAVGIVVATVAWVVRQSIQSRHVLAAEDETGRAAHTVALLLRAGQIPTRALVEAAADNPCLAPAAAAVGLGGDAGRALVGIAGEPGRRGMAQLAAAWRVSESSGAPVATVVAQVTETMRRERQLADVVAAELSAARASGRIMATLPLVAIGLGTVVGADPVSFLFGSVLGQVLLVVGLALAAAGVVWTEKIARSPMGVGRR